ncbi:MAG TPA: SulP family inorganic anion transporter [Methylovirgula sp.]
MTLRSDALAGLLGAVLALPQGIAFATLAGLPPQYGIYSAIVPCAVAALFGSSHHVISGPTNANSLALFAALSPLAIPGSPHYIAFALAVTGLVGIMQLAVGGFRLGWVTDFIAPAVLLGFMSGAAILIGLYALPDLLGLNLPDTHGVFAVLSGLSAKIQYFNPSAVIVAVSTFAVTIGMARLSRRLPFMLMGIVAGLAVSELLARYPSWPSMSRVGTIPSILPSLSLPSMSLARLPEFVSIAGALSIVALGQSVSIAKALAQRSGQRLDVNREFIGQGLSNIVGSFFSCYVSCGSLNRSLPNFLAGAQTQLAGVFSAIFLVLLALATRPLLERLPMPAIAALLIYIAFGLIDVRGFIRLARVHQADLGVASVTLVGMLFLPFQQAILIGGAFSLLLYLHRTAHPAIRALVPDPASPDHAFTPIVNFPDLMPECPQIKLIRVEGSIYFGAAGYVSQVLHNMRKSATQKHLLAMVKSMNFIDLAGAEVWENELSARRAMGGDLYFHSPRSAVRQIWQKIGFDVRLGPKNIFDRKHEALASIYTKLDHDICAACSVRIFAECRKAHSASDAAADMDLRGFSQQTESQAPEADEIRGLAPK